MRLCSRLFHIPPLGGWNSGTRLWNSGTRGGTAVEQALNADLGGTPKSLQELAKEVLRRTDPHQSHGTERGTSAEQAPLQGGTSEGPFLARLEHAQPAAGDWERRQWVERGYVLVQSELVGELIVVVRSPDRCAPR